MVHNSGVEQNKRQPTDTEAIRVFVKISREFPAYVFFQAIEMVKSAFIFSLMQ